MQIAEKSKLTLRLSFLVGLILLLLPNVFQWINDELICQLGEWFGYKMLLTIPLILLLIIAYQRLSHRLDLLHKTPEITSQQNSPPTMTRPDSVSGTWEQIDEHRDTLLKNLATDEKELLRKFIDQSKRTITLGFFDSVANGLVKQGILIFSNSCPDFRANYMVSNWAWMKLKDNPKLLK